MNVTELEIGEFLKRYEDATNSHVFSNVADLIHSEAIYRFTDGDFVGIEAIQKAFERTWTSIENETYSLSDLRVVSTDQNTASITYTFSWSGVVDGVQKSESGRGTNIIVRVGEKLQFIHEHLSK